jgi:hypothetical protein
MIQRIILLFLTPLICLSLAQPNFDQRTWAQTTPNYPEGNDFATQVLRSPWTMSDYSEISQYINQSGQSSLLQSINLAGGIFSARSTATADAQFYPLFPGYWTVMLIGKVGHNYPI